MSSLLKNIEKIVLEAGEILLEAAPSAAQISAKEGHGNFVTDYDVRVQEVLFQKFRTLLPEAGFIVEEGHGAMELSPGYTFIIDPIDGTTNFICGYQFSAISVALALAGQPVLGVVYNPFRKELYMAEQGAGAFLNGQPLKLRDRALSEGVVCCGTSPYNTELTDRTFEIMKVLFLNSMDIRRQGSAALDICYLAANRNVLFFEGRLSPWDYAAAWVVLREAGGVLTTMEGGAPTLTAPCSILAGTPKAVADFQRLIRLD